MYQQLISQIALQALAGCSTGAKNKCHANREFHRKIQRDFHKHPNQAQIRNECPRTRA